MIAGLRRLLHGVGRTLMCLSGRHYYVEYIADGWEDFADPHVFCIWCGQAPSS